MDCHTLIRDCFPPEYDIFRFYAEKYQTQFASLLRMHVDPDTSEIAPLSEVLRFLLAYRQQLQTTAPEQLQVVLEEVAEIIEAYLDGYVERSRQKLLGWVDRILSREATAEVHVDSDGYFYTKGPRDIFESLQRVVKGLFKYCPVSEMSRTALAKVSMLCTSTLVYVQAHLKAFLIGGHSVVGGSGRTSSTTTSRGQGDSTAAQSSSSSSSSARTKLMGLFGRGKERKEELPPKPVQETTSTDSLHPQEQDDGEPNNQLVFIGGSWKPLSYVLAQINNTIAYEKQTRVLQQYILKHPQQGLEMLEELDECFLEASSNFIEVGNSCVQVLVEHICDQLELPLKKFFTQDW